jgi:hypothetical protein
MGRDDELNLFREPCEVIVNGLKNWDVNFIGLDFDRTFVSCHTDGDDGRFTGTSDELYRYVRPVFELLVPMAMDMGESFSSSILSHTHITIRNPRCHRHAVSMCSSNQRSHVVCVWA